VHGDDIELTSRVIRSERKGKISLAIEERNVATRGVVVLELDATVAHGFVVRRVAAGGEDGEVVAVEVDLDVSIPIS
jgi:hypothetical protein